MKLKFSVLSGLVGLSCILGLPAHAQGKSDTAPPSKPLQVAQAGAPVGGMENGYPDVNPVFALKAGRLVCGSRRVPMDVKIEGANDQAVLLTWDRKDYILKRRPTSTGAYHFDDAKAGFVLIQIPTKSMLFDKKNMTRLADDCVPSP